MKSIKQQYIDLREGNMSQANFMRSIRMSLPQYVTNITSFNDSVKILKNKGILTEADMNMDSSELAMGIKVEMEHTEDMAVAKKIAMDHLAENPKYYSELKASGIEKLQATSDEPGSPIKNISLNTTTTSSDVNLNRANPRDGFTLGFYEGKESAQITPEAIEVALENMWEEGLIDNVTWKTASKALPNFDIDGNTNMVGTSTADDLARELVFVATGNNVPDIVDYDEEEAAEAERINMMVDQERENRFNENKSLNEAKDESSEGKWKTVTGKELYAQFKEIDNLNGQEVLIGIDFEMIKNPELSKLEAAKIVVKNLKKNSIYYTAQDMSGVEGYEIGYIGGKSADAEARQMQYLDKNMGNVVDKKMGMKPVKDVEKVKKDSNKGGETNKTVKGVSSMSLVAKSVRGLQKMDATGEKIKKVSVKENLDFTKFKTGVDQNDWTKMTPDQKKAVLSEPTMQKYIGTKTPEQLTILANLSWKEITSNTPERQAAGIAPNASVLNGFFNTPSPLKKASKVAKTIFDKNAGITAKLKSLTKDDLMEMIRKEIAGAYGGDQMNAEDGSSYINKD